MKYTIIGKTTELQNNEKKMFTYNNQDILLVNIDGSFYAVNNKCPHMGGSLFEGNLEGYTIVCPRHGSGFDVRTGELIEPGKMLYIKVKPKGLQTYNLKIEGTDILIGSE